MIELFARRLRSVSALLAVAVLLVACANPAIEDAKKLASRGQHEAALQRLKQATETDQSDKLLRNALLQQRDTTVEYLIYLAEAAKSGGRIEDVQSVLDRLQAAAPDHPRVAWLRSEVERLKRHQRLMNEAQKSFEANSFDKAEAALRGVLSEEPGNSKARAMLTRIEETRETQTRQQSTLQLATAGKVVTLEFREASIKTVFESLARAADVNFVFDKDVRSDAKVTLFLRNTTVDEAMRVILSTQQLASKLLNDNTVLVFPATQQKQRDLLDTVTRTFFLVNADPKQAQALVRTVAKTRDIFIDERLNLLVVRDTPEVVRLIERLIQNIDLADPEVMLELEVMEVSDNQLNSLGLTWPTTGSFGVPDSTASLTSFTGLHAFTTNPLALATLKASHNATNILANPKIRARNREKARVLLGEKLPVFTTTSTPNNGGISSAVAVNYVDVGLKLDVEPQVQLDNDVTIKVALEVSSITAAVSGPAGSLAYQVGTRQATTTLRLRDGETQVLAGLINDSESRSSAGIPGLHDMPIAGRLFGLTTDERKRSEIVLLVTPHIVRNVVQPSTSGSPMASGTEAQPGAPAMIMRDAASSSGMGKGTGAAAPATPSSRPGAPTEVIQSVTGPEEVQPGATFEVVVHNGAKVALSTGLLLDPSALELITGQSLSRVEVSVPAGGYQTIMLRAKREVKEAEVTLQLESGGEPWPMHIRYPVINAQPDGTDPPEQDPNNGQ